MPKLFHCFNPFKHEYLITNKFRYRHCELKVYNTSQQDIYICIPVHKNKIINNIYGIGLLNSETLRQVIYNGAMGVEFTILLGKSISLNDDTF